MCKFSCEINRSQSLIDVNVTFFSRFSSILCIKQSFRLISFVSTMIESIIELPNDILVEFFTRYVSNEDLRRLQLVCRRFYSILERYPTPWKKTLSRKTNVSFSCLKNAAGCPAIEVSRKTWLQFDSLVRLERSTYTVHRVSSLVLARGVSLWCALRSFHRFCTRHHRWLPSTLRSVDSLLATRLWCSSSDE